MKDKAVGFYLTMVAAILSIVGLVLYPGVMYRLTVVYVFCAVAIVLAVLVLVLSFTGKSCTACNYLPVINAVLMACAAVWAVYLMVNQLGYVVSELDDKSTIMGFVYFEAVAVVSMLLNIVASFMKQTKN